MKRSWTKDAIGRIHKQRWMVLACSVVMSLVLVFGVTFAWFTTSDSRTNPFKTPHLTFGFEVVETFTPPSEVDPGESIVKVVKVKNTGELPGFVRVLAVTEIVSKEGVLLPGNAPTEFTIDGLNTTDWKDGGDGYYYYLHQLAPGAETPALFTGITLASGLDAAYENAGMKIDIKLEAVEIAKWKYREGWWGSALAPADPSLVVVDNALNLLAA